MQTLSAFLNFLASLAWPGVVLYLLGWRFRDAIISIIARVRKIGPTGAEIADQRGEDPLQIEQVQPERPPATFTPLYETLMQSGREKIDHLAGTGNAAARERAALWLYARAWIMRTHELNYRVIFGSQLKGLRFLNEHRLGVPDLRSLYLAAFNTPELQAEVSYERWERFLTHNSGLVERSNGNLVLTEAGNSFLQHIIEHGYTENIPL